MSRSDAIRKVLTAHAKTGGERLHFLFPGDEASTGPEATVLALPMDGAGLPLATLRALLVQAATLLPPGGELLFLTRNPARDREDANGLLLPGEQLQSHYYRPLRHYLTLAARFSWQIEEIRPIPLDEVAGRSASHLLFRWTRVSDAPVWPRQRQHATRYGEDAIYPRLKKLEDPDIYEDLRRGIEALAPPPDGVICSFGVHDAAEWQVFFDLGLPEARTTSWHFVGVDRDGKALARARKRFPGSTFTLLEQSIETLDSETVPPVDALLCLNTLQSRSVDRDAALRTMHQLLKPRCRVLFSIPCCHWTERDLVRGALTRNRSEEDASLAIKDARYLARHLYRKKFDTVEIFGSHYLYVLGRRTEVGDGVVP